MDTCQPDPGLASSTIQVMASFCMACWVCGCAVRGVSSTEVEGKSSLLANVPMRVELFT